MTIADKPDYIKEHIKFESEFFKQLFTLFLLLTSGTVTLLVRVLGNGESWLNNTLVIIGSGLSIASIFILRGRYRLIYKLLDDLNQD